MKVLRILFSFGVILIVVTYAGCSKSSTPAPAEVQGKWTYTTTDGKIKVNFELLKSATGTISINSLATMTVNGISGNAAAQVTGVNIPSIASISINANDAALTYPYFITFNLCTFVSSANRIDVANGTYSAQSNGTSSSFNAVSIVRP